MALGQKLVQRQNLGQKQAHSQSLVMTPQLSQSIKLLAMSNVELSAFVEDELERNPFLERDARPDGEAQDSRTMETSAVETEEVRDVTAHTELEISASSLEENLGTRIENLYPDEQDYSRATADKAPRDDTRMTLSGLAVASSSDAYGKTVAEFSADDKTLNQHLMEQAGLAHGDASTLFVLKALIETLDDAGYIDDNLEELSHRLNCTDEVMDAALSLLQSFEPAGVGARNLAECLSLQLRERDRLDPAMQTVIGNLDLLAKRDFTALCKLTGLEMADINECVREIRELDPKPGTAFDSTPVQHVAADVFVNSANDGSWKIELNSETLPRVLVNESYITSVSPKLLREDDQDFVSQCLQTASWLTKSLDQRALTIMKVASEIVRKQDEFMVHGVAHLKPLTLKAVADEIDMHESTVSRVTSNKYMMTPRGLFELKYFFSTAISNSSGGDSHSSESVRQQIKLLIEAETVESVLSDDAIVEALKVGGVEIARRTVAKYRDAMHIPSSVQRRRELRAAKANL